MALLNLVCRYHVSEIVFSLHDSARSPKLELFSHFRDFRPQIDQVKYRTAMENKDIAPCVTEIRHNVVTFALQQLSTEYNRDDYKELLDLSSGTQGHFTERIGWHCGLCDQDVTSESCFPFTTTLEHTENISTTLLSKGMESFTLSVTFCDNNLCELGLQVQ